MSHLQPKRGRPKGSGIDDSATLREIANAISADKELKPTTAIRRLGISDPSTIRRLRDKFMRNREILLAEIKTKKAHKSTLRQKKVSRRTSSSPYILKTPPNYGIDRANLMTGSSKSFSPALFLSHTLEPWLTANASFMSSAMQTHLFLVSRTKNLPQLTCAMTQYLALTPWLLAFAYAPAYCYPKPQKFGVKRRV